MVTVEELQLIITAQVKQAVQELGRGRQEMAKFTKEAEGNTRKWREFFKQHQATFTGIVMTTRNMMHAIIEASPSMTIAMEDMSWHFEMMSYQIGEATAPIMEAMVPIIEAMAEAFGDLPQPMQMMIGVMIMGTAMVGQMTMAFGPLGLAIMGIVIGMMLLYTAWQEDWGGIQGKVEAVWNVIEPIFNAIKWYFETWIKILVTLKEGFGKAKDALYWFGDKIVWVKDLIDWFISCIDRFIGWLEDLIEVVKDLIDWLKELWDWVCKLGDYLPGSLAKKGPFSKPLRFDAYFKAGIEPVKHIIEGGLERPLAVAAPLVGGGGGSVVNNYYTPTIHVTLPVGAVGSSLEAEVLVKRVLDGVHEEMTRRTV